MNFEKPSQNERMKEYTQDCEAYEKLVKSVVKKRHCSRRKATEILYYQNCDYPNYYSYFPYHN
jgi:hypothetical protein